MPSLKVHAAHTKKIYGVEAIELHQWLDEPVKLLGPHHRDLRHDRLTLKNIPQKFIRELGKRLAQDVIVDHFLLDKKPHEKRSENSLLHDQQKQVIDYAEIVKKDEKKQLEKVDILEPNQKKILELLTTDPNSSIMDIAKLLYLGQDIEYGGKQYNSTCRSFHMLEERGLIEKTILKGPIRDLELDLHIDQKRVLSAYKKVDKEDNIEVIRPMDTIASQGKLDHILNRGEQNLPLLIFEKSAYPVKNVYHEILSGSDLGHKFCTLLSNGYLGTNDEYDYKALAKLRIQIIMQTKPDKPLFATLSGKFFTPSELLQEIEKETPTGQMWVDNEMKHMDMIGTSFYEKIKNYGD